MNNYITLTKVLLKTSLTSLSKKKSQKWLYLLLVICFIPNLFVTTTMYNDSIQALEPLHQVEYIYSIGLQSTTVVIFIFSAFLIPSIYYFSKDLIHLLPMPITSECIIASKLTVCIIYEYLFCILILGPLFLAFILNGYSSIFFWLMNILVFITLPIYPLMISSILILIIMRFAPFVRRKDIFNIVGSFLLIGISLSFSMLMNNLDDNMMNALLQGGGMLNHLSLLLPHIHFITQVIFNNAYLYIIGYFIVHIIVGTLFILCAKAIYLKAALSIEETNSSRKALTNEQLEKKLKQGNVLKEYTIKELKILLRTPAYILNCVLTELIFPIVMIISFSASGDEFLPYIREYIPYIPNLPAYLCLIALGIGMFASQSSMVTATSISREGKGYVFMKYIPVSLRTILNAKVLSGTCIYDKENKEPKKISITLEKINRILGSNISLGETIAIFERLGFEAVSKGERVEVIVPTRRIDIEIEEDLIEEVGRIYGVNNIEGKLPKLPTMPGKFNTKLRSIRNKMIALRLK